MSEAPRGFTRSAEGVLRYKGSDWRGYGFEPKEAVEFPIYDNGSIVGYGIRCVAPTSDGFLSSACAKPAKHDPDYNGNFTKCGIHCEATKKKRKERQKAKWDAEDAKRRKSNAPYVHKKTAPDIITQIAEGHNNPRGLCQQWLNELNRLESAKGE